MYEYIRNNDIIEWVYKIKQPNSTIYDRDIKKYFTNHTICLCNVIIAQNCFIVHKDNPNVVLVIGNICMNKFTDKDRRLKCPNCGKGRFVNEDGICSKCRKEKETEIRKQILRDYIENDIIVIMNIISL